MQLRGTRYFSKISVMGSQSRGIACLLLGCWVEYHITALSILRWAPGPKPIAVHFCS